LDPDAHLAAEGVVFILLFDLEKKASSLDASSINSTQGSSPITGRDPIFLDLPKKLEFDQTFRYVRLPACPIVGAYTTADVRIQLACHSFSRRVSRGAELVSTSSRRFGVTPVLCRIKRSAYIKLTCNHGRDKREGIYGADVLRCTGPESVTVCPFMLLVENSWALAVAWVLVAIMPHAQQSKPTEYQVKAATSTIFGRFR